MGMIIRKQFSFIFLLLMLFGVSVKKTYSQGTAGQKAHFQVEDKSGDLKITATKDLAKVTAQADSVQVVVKPGMADYPVLKSDKPLVHVVNGVNGWNTLSFKRSSILRKDWKEGGRYVHPLFNSSGRKKNNKGTKRVKSKKRKFSGSHASTAKDKSVTSEGKKSSLQIKLNKNSQSKVNIEGKSRSFHLQQEKKDDVQGSKKSETGEVSFRVNGSAGKLNMDVTRNETKLLSESGSVDVFLSKKAGSKQTKAADSELPTAGMTDRIVHVAPELRDGNLNDIGLRKSNVPVKGNDLEPSE